MQFSNFTPEDYELLAAMKHVLATNPEERKLMGECQLCGSNIRNRDVTLFAGLIRAMHSVALYLKEKDNCEFNIKEVKDLMGKNEYARFGDLVRFGGIIYRPENKKGVYGMNMERVESFFKGQYKIPVQITLNQITNEIERSNYVTIHQFPELKELCNKDGLYKAY